MSKREQQELKRDYPVETRGDEKEEYMEKTIEIMRQVNDVWILVQIYRCAVNMTEED